MFWWDMVSESKFYIILFYKMLHIKKSFFCLFFRQKMYLFVLQRYGIFFQLFNYVKELSPLSRGFQKNKVVLDLVITSMLIS